MRHAEHDRKVADLLQPLTTRSVVLSALLGTHPPALPANRLVRIGALFGIAEGTVRVALSRMTAAGELRREDNNYGLTDRLTDRQRRQDASRWPRTSVWDGEWQMVAVTAPRRSRAERETFRRDMRAQQLAELREGLWLRPNNLVERSVVSSEGCEQFTARPAADPTELAARLWDLADWSDRAQALCEAMRDSFEISAAFTVSAAVFRHLLIDPVLPPELLPTDWPGDALRDRYAAFDADFRQQLTDRLDLVD